MLRPFALGMLVIAAAGCKKTPTEPPPPPPPTVQSVAVSPESETLASLGEATTFTAEVRLSNGSVGTQTPTWNSSNPAVATVASGTVTAVGNGQTTISAVVGSASGSATVTVAQVVASVRLLPADTVIKGPAQLRGAALDARGNPVAGAALQWEALIQEILTQTGKTAPQLEAAYLAHARGL